MNKERDAELKSGAYPEPNEWGEVKSSQAPQNGQRADSDAPDASEAPREWFEADRISLSLVLAKKRGPRGVKVSEVNYMGPEQQPLVLFADADALYEPWGQALEKLIAAAIARAEQQG